MTTDPSTEPTQAPPPIQLRGDSIGVQVITGPDGAPAPVLVIGAGSGMFAASIVLTVEAVDAITEAFSTVRPNMAGPGLVVAGNADVAQFARRAPVR